MSDTLIIGGQTYSNVTGIKATDDNEVIQIYSKGGGGSSTTTPYYMWMDSENYIHISSSEHSGYCINVASVEDQWNTIYEATISDWDQLEHCYDYYVENVSLGLVPGDTYRVTYDNVVYTTVCIQYEGTYLGSNVYGWDGVSPLDYPFQIMDGLNEAYIDVTTGGTHTFKIEYGG